MNRSGTVARGEKESDLKEEQLLKRQASSSALEVRRRLREVDGGDRFGLWEQVVFRREVRRNDVAQRA